MKRSRMPDRTTPLRTETPLERGTRPLRSSGPIKARRRDTGPSKKVRDLVRQRAGNACELCGRTEGRMDTHHRRPRGAGGSSDPATNQASNLILLCRESHRVLESQRLWARMHGWLVPQGTDPSSVAVSIRGQWVYLNDDGAYVVVPQAKEAS